MNFLFRGQVCGRICDDCTEPLSNVLLRLYRPAQEADLALQASAAAKHTVAGLPETAVSAKASRLLAETTADEQGNFLFELDGKKLEYQGGAFEIDVRLEQVPGENGRSSDPVQFTVTTLQPRWRERDNQLVAVWQHCLPARIWCAIRALFDAWVICGQVVVAASGAPVPNVVVSAFDNDWIADDPLGTATTDSNGRFRINYTSQTFKQTFLSPIVNVDTPLFTADVGPDVYFHVDTLLNTPLLHEDPSVGYTPSRENIGNCFCVTLRLEEAPPGGNPQVEPLPVFDHIGGYHFLTAIDSSPAGDGKTTADDRAFYSNLRLNGILPKRINGNPCEYRFEVAEWSGGSLGSYTPVPLSQVAKTKIGSIQRVTADPINPVQTEPYFVNGNPATENVATVTADGWIQVPQESNAFTVGYFQPNGNMIRLISTQLASQLLDMSGLQAGQSATSTGQPLAANRFFSIRMWVREAGVPGSNQLAGTCQRLAICNARYDNVPQGGSWAPSIENNRLALHTIDISELAVDGCAKVTNTLTVLYSAAAANIGTVTLSMNGPGGPYGFSPIVSSPDTFGTAVPTFVVSDLAACAYTVQLSVQVLLTTGDSIPDNLHDQIAFCK